MIIEAKPMPPQAELIRMFDYSPETGVLTWKEPSRKVSYAGRPAGWTMNTGHIQVRVGRKMFLAHRIIWSMTHGDIPTDMRVDHINGNRADNRLTNLRLLSMQENAVNRRPNRRASSRFKGVSLMKSRGKVVIRARINIDGRMKSLGCFSSEEDAARAYDEAAVARWGRLAATNASLGLIT